LNHTYKEVVAEKLYLFSSGNFLFRRSSAEWPQHIWWPQFGLQLVRRDGKWDKVNPTARPENGQRLAGYVGIPDL